MSWILCIDTATRVCSVALAREDRLVSLEESLEDRTHAANLTLFIDRVLRENQLDPSSLAAIAVSQGPGSYTGLRIGVSVAKGLAYGTGMPMIAVDTLQSMARGIISHPALEAIHPPDREKALYAPMIDARRMEVYTAFFDHLNRPLGKTEAVVVNGETFTHILDQHQVVFFGDGAPKCRDKITHPNAFFIDSYTISSQHMIPLAWEAFGKKMFVDLAYFEPFYLKDFLATIPKNKLIT